MVLCVTLPPTARYTNAIFYIVIRARWWEVVVSLTCGVLEVAARGHMSHDVSSDKLDNSVMLL